MKFPIKKITDERRIEDETLFGLLSSYKSLITYFRILTSKKDDRLIVQITGNPRHLSQITPDKYASYIPVRRVAIGVTKLCVKYISPEYLIRYLGPMLGIKLPSKKVAIINNLDKDGYFILETPLEALPLVIQAVKRMLLLSPQKKYEILEKFLSEEMPV